jgi:DNA polymerase-4/DNA polymerase V
MSDIIFSLSSCPRAIVHIDGDAFSNSCEEVICNKLKGKPLITGGERSIVACASYPAKMMGISRRGLCIRRKESVLIPLFYLRLTRPAASFPRRIFNIMRRFTPNVEEYSIDEAFCDITGLRRVLWSSYVGIAEKMKNTIERELGRSVSAGVSLTQVLAKVGSKYQKPDGLTVIAGRYIARFLENLPVGKVWGIGPATSSYLEKMGIMSALDFAQMPEAVVRKRLTKPGI